MTPERFTQLLEAYGARPERWPEAERAAALALLERSAGARAQRDAAAALDAVLERAPAAAPSAALAGRILAGAPRPRVVRLRRPGRAGIVAAMGFAAAASVALWMVGRSDRPSDLEPAALAQLDDYETPTDALLSAIDPDVTDAVPVFGCDDPQIDCDDPDPAAAAPAPEKEMQA